MAAIPFLLAGAAFSGAAATIGTAIAATITTAAVSTAAATAIGVGTLSAVATAVQGGSVSDVLKSAVLGGLTSYVGGTIAADIGTAVAQDAFFTAIDAGFASSASIAVSEFAGSAISGAITSSFNALLNERDPIEAFIKGGLSAGVSSAVSSAVNEVIKDVPGLEQIRGTAAGNAVERALKTSIANSILTNEDFDQSFIESLTESGANYLLNTAQSTLKDFGSNLLKDSELVKNSEEQVDGLINREKDLVTRINNYIPEVQGIANSIKENETTQNAWAAEANSFIPTLQNLESRANSVTAMANEIGTIPRTVLRDQQKFLINREGATIGNYYFAREEFTDYVSDWESGNSYAYPSTRIVVVNNNTGEKLYDYIELIKDVNANAEYINNTYPPVKSQFDNAINNLNGAKAQYSNLVNYFNNAKNTLDGYKTELNQVRTDYNSALKTFNANYANYEATLQNFISAEAENAQIIDKLIRDSAQVISSYEADYGAKPTSQQLADFAASGNGDLASGFKSFDANNVSAKEAREFLEANGYNPTDEEIQQFVRQENEQVIKENIDSYLNDKRSADTVGGIAGADTVNAGVAQNDLLDLIQKDIDTSVANNTQGTLNAEQEIQSATPVEPGTSEFTIPGGTTVGGATQDDVLGIVAQEQAANQAQSTNQAMQGAQQITTAEAAARELYPLTERYLGPNGTVYMRDINTGKIIQVLPQGDISQVTGGGVYLDTPTVIGAIESLPASAVYEGILYADDPKLIGKQLTADDLSSLSMSSGRDPNVLPVGNLVVTQNADGTVTQRDKATGDTATIDGSGNIVSQTKSVYTRANEVAGGLTGTAQAGLGGLGAALAATAQQLGVDSQDVIDTFSRIQTSGELMRPETVNQQSQAFVDEIYRVASDPNATTEQIARAIASATLNNPAGAAAILGTELIQELPVLLLPGGKVAQFLGSMALNAAESAGAQALQKIDELKVTNPNATPQELARMARQDAGVAGAVTAAIGLIPGANNVIARTLLEPFTEYLEEGLIEYAISGDANAARGKAVLGAVIGGKTAAAINTGEQLATAVQNNLGVQVPGGVAAPSGASLTVSSTRLPTDSTETNVDPGVDLTPDNLGTLPTTGVDIPTFDVATDTGVDQNTGVVVEVDPDSNQASVIDNTGALTIVPANGLTPGQTTVVPTTPVVTDTSPVVTTPPTTEVTGIVLQDNGDETSLVLTQDGSSTVVPSVDSSTDNQLQPGSTVVVNTGNNTASTAPVTQETGGSTVSQDAGQVGETGVTADVETQPVVTQPVVTTPPVLTPEQIAAQELDAEVQKIMRMAVKKDPVDMRYDLNKDGRVNVIDALALKRGQATVPTVEEYQASLAQQEAARVAAEQEAARAEAARVAAAQEQERAAAAAEQERLIQTTGTTTGTTTGATTDATTGATTGSTSGSTADAGAGTSTGVVLQDNGDGTVLVLTSDGNASIVSDVDSNTGNTLTAGSSVVVDNNTGTATGGVATDSTTGTTTDGTAGSTTSVTGGVDTGETTGAATGETVDTGATSGTTGSQIDTGGSSVITDASSGGGQNVSESTGTSTLTPGISVEPPETIGGGNDLIVGGNNNNVTSGATNPEKDLLLELIIQELETKPPVSEGVPIPEPEFPEPPLVLPELPTINVDDSLTVRPRVGRRVTRPSVSPGSRVEESAQILPLRPGLSEGGTGGIEGTPEEEQEPVWNVRSLKLRRLLGI